MALLRKFGNLVRQSAGSGSSLYQAVRCMSSSKLFIGGISYGTDDQSLKEAFANYGEVIEARVIMDRTTGRSRGFGFVTYTSTDEAAAAITGMDGKDLQGRIVRVSYAHDRGSRAGGYRGGGYGGQGAYGNGGDGGYSDGGRGYGSGSGGGYSNFSNYGGYNTSGGYNSVGGRGGYGVSEGGHGYGSGTGYAGDSGGYYTAPGNYSGDNFRHGGAAPGVYEGGNYGGSSNNSYTSNATSDESAGKLDDLLSDLNVGDGQGDGESKDEGVGLVDEDLKGDDQEELIQDDLKDADVADDYANKTS
ncbi:glycine-rich RNA-binding protein 2-like [Oryza brachyantha]|uniref:RRM domain-containing protein n=1 Tax=Oryza brachyantha TaxID=4533 RepID=J3N1R4_ORYBR|nr:glycine-rich RNA-binding protein 2-like [Oryza brachyantha]XP_040384010.1 glycine-rich RNA-binding protein 2-like [Oryza brachyantha]